MLLQLFSLTLGHIWDSGKQKSTLSTQLILYSTIDLHLPFHLIIFICSFVSISLSHTYTLVKVAIMIKGWGGGKKRN